MLQWDHKALLMLRWDHEALLLQLHQFSTCNIKWWKIQTCTLVTFAKNNFICIISVANGITKHSTWTTCNIGSGCRGWKLIVPCGNSGPCWSFGSSWRVSFSCWSGFAWDGLESFGPSASWESWWLSGSWGPNTTLLLCLPSLSVSSWGNRTCVEGTTFWLGSTDRGVSGSVVVVVVVVVVVAGVVKAAVVDISSSVVVVVVVTCSPSDNDSWSDLVVTWMSSLWEGVENKIFSSSAAILSLSNSFSGSSLIWFESRPPLDVSFFSPLLTSFLTFDWNDRRVCCKRALLLNVTWKYST